MRRFRSLAGVLALLFALLAGWPTPLSAACRPRTVAPELIPRAAKETLAYVRRHQEAPAGQVGGRTFGNYGRGGEQKLPVQDAQGSPIRYREWDIYPKRPGRSRGAERIVTGSDGRAWYTADHYCTFTEMR